MDCALYAGGRRLHRLDDLQVAMREAEKEDGFVWIGLHDPTTEEFDALAVGFRAAGSWPSRTRSRPTSARSSSGTAT